MMLIDLSTIRPTERPDLLDRARADFAPLKSDPPPWLLIGATAADQLRRDPAMFNIVGKLIAGRSRGILIL